jgi:hypothetical protein
VVNARDLNLSLNLLIRTEFRANPACSEIDIDKPALKVK